MSRATQLIAKVDGILKRLNPSRRPVYKRLITRTGGDALIGRPGTVTYVDTLLVPQPLVEEITPSVIRRAHINNTVMVGTDALQLGDYLCLFSPTSVTRTELLNPDLVFVFNDGGITPVEERYVATIGGNALNGLDVVTEVILRSKSNT